MTNSPNPGTEPTPNPRPRWPQRLRRIAIPIGVVSLAGLAGGAWWGWIFVTQELAPLIQTNLSQALKRPVQLGQVERFSLTGIRFGPSAVPATATDRDRLTLAAIDVKFNPLRVLLTRNLNLDITAEKPQIYLEQAQDGTWISTQIEQEEDQGPIRTDIEAIHFEDASVVLVPAGKRGGLAKPVSLAAFSGDVRFFDGNERITYEATGRSLTGGTLRLNGESIRKPLATNIQIQAQNFLVAEVDRLARLPIDLPAGRANGNITVQLRPDQKQPELSGTAQFKDVTLKAAQIPKPVTRANGSLQLAGTRIRLDPTTAFYGSVPALARGELDTQKGFNLAFTVKPVSLKNILETLAVTVPVSVAGEIQADLKLTGPIDSPVLSGVARSTRPGKVDQIALSQYGTRFQLDTANSRLVVSEIRATPTAGGRVTGSGTVGLANRADQTTLAFSLQAIDVPGDPIARVYNSGNATPFAIGRINAQAQVAGTASNPQTEVRWQAREGTYTGNGRILVANGGINLRDTTLNVAGGTVNVNATAAQGRWQANVIGTGVRLRQFSPDLRGLFSGNLTLAGSLDSLRPAAVRARGQVRFSEGIAVVAKPLTAQILWDGEKIVLQQATSPGLSASGAIYAQLEGPAAPAIARLDLTVRTEGYALQDFAVPVPAQVSYSGRADFVGRVTGTPSDPKVVGDLALRQFVLNGVAFEPVLQGNLRLDRGVSLNLQGQQDRIIARLDAAYQPVAFDIQRGTAIARGRTQGDLLLVEAQQFPLAFLRPIGLANQFPVTGDLTGTLAVNLRTLNDPNRLSATGQVTISSPSIAGFRADQFGGRIAITNGVASLSGAELRRGDSIFQLSGSANLLATDPNFQGQLKVTQGDVQDVLELLQLYDIGDLGRGLDLPTFSNASALSTIPVELANTPLIDQLRRLSEIQSLLAQTAAARRANPIPELSELKGKFDAAINVGGSLQKGLTADFQLSGSNWQWRDYLAKQVVVRGTFAEGALTLLPLRIQSDEALIAFTGQVGGTQQSGQFRMENIPVESLTELFALPIDLEGQLNVNATLAGSLTNPQAIGLIQLNNGIVNGTEIQTARGNFRYENSRLDFGSNILISGTEPLTITASLPYRLPTSTVQPASNEIRLDVNVKDEGLAFLNLLNNQVAWESGMGRVNLQVRGTLLQPIATGIAEVKNATLRVKALPDPLTDVNASIRFEQDRLRVDSVKGQFSRGTVAASGVLPILVPLDSTDPDNQTPLGVNLNNINLSLKGLYQGGVDGQIQVTGTALNPLIGGVIQLSRGQVLLSDPTQTAAATVTSDNLSDSGSNVEFNNLTIELGNAVRITSAPILNFVASGSFTVAGSLDDPRPKGTINLNAGQVNLFSTQFVLARGYTQTATFDPSRGLDPFLDVRLTALVSEVIGSRLPTSSNPSEITDTTSFNRYGSLQSVRVQARVFGPASQLNENLELSSSPARSTTEIVSLLGASSFSQGGGALGLANLAGSALLTNVQSVIGNALGLSEFRLFPTITPNREARNRSSTNLDLAAEAGIDITGSLSVSVLKVLTADIPAQFGLRYRFNDQLLFRSSTDFSGDSRAVIEYETRF